MALRILREHIPRIGGSHPGEGSLAAGRLMLDIIKSPVARGTAPASVIVALRGSIRENASQLHLIKGPRTQN